MIEEWPSGSRQWRLCTLSAMEFISRFLQHVLPKGYVKVRYFGFFSPGQHRKLHQICDFLSRPPPLTQPQGAAESDAGTTEALPQLCPHCGHPLRLTQTLRPLADAQWPQQPFKPLYGVPTKQLHCAQGTPASGVLICACLLAAFSLFGAKKQTLCSAF